MIINILAIGYVGLTSYIIYKQQKCIKQVKKKLIKDEEIDLICLDSDFWSDYE